MCSRSRFWASLHMDGELSELEGALLDAHVARCADCAAFLLATEASTLALRSQPQAVYDPVEVIAHRSPGRILVSSAAAAAVVAAALLGGLLHGSASTSASTSASRAAVVGVPSLETPDQLRRLRRSGLLIRRSIPRHLPNEPS